MKKEGCQKQISLSHCMRIKLILQMIDDDFYADVVGMLIIREIDFLHSLLFICLLAPKKNIKLHQIISKRATILYFVKL